jgi:hypothetical protein
VVDGCEPDGQLGGVGVPVYVGECFLPGTVEERGARGRDFDAVVRGLPAYADTLLAQWNGESVDAAGESQGVEVSGEILNDDYTGGTFVQSCCLAHGFPCFLASHTLYSRTRSRWIGVPLDQWWLAVIKDSGGYPQLGGRFRAGFRQTWPRPGPGVVGATSQSSKTLCERDVVFSGSPGSSRRQQGAAVTFRRVSSGVPGCAVASGCLCPIQGGVG